MNTSWQKTIIALILLLAVFKSATSNLCRTHRARDTVEYDCPRGRYDFPGNFDVALLNQTATNLTVHGSSNVVHANYTPFPESKALFFVYFKAFNQEPEDPRFPLNGLFQHNKHHIAQLSLVDVKLGYLTGEDLSGFSKLQYVVLQRTGLNTIALSTFDLLGLSPDGTALPHFKPELKIVVIRETKLISLDWTFLKPIRDSLEELDVDAPMENVTCSVPFTIKRPQRLDVTSPRPNFRPADVYLVYWYFAGQPIEITADFGKHCSGSLGCGCCDSAELAAWLNKNPHVTMVQDTGCDAQVRNRTVYQETALYSCPV